MIRVVFDTNVMVSATLNVSRDASRLIYQDGP